MADVISVISQTHKFELNRDLSVTIREQEPGPPKRIDGVTIALVTVEGDSPHNGERHPDGDEILLVISGKISVQYDSAPNAPVVVGPSQACVVPKGEWHQVNMLEKAQLIHITPGPNGDFRPK